MDKKYRIELYGKKNCDKCYALKKRIKLLLEKNTKYSENFSYIYHDLNTVDGLVAFAKAETINGQRIPTIQITKYNHETKEYRKIPDQRPEQFIDDKLKVPVYLQLETDYSNHKGAVIKPQEIKELCNMALDY